MPIVGEHVEIERKPKLGGGGPGKTPHRRGYGGGDDGDRGRRDDFYSSSHRLRRGRIGITLVIALVSMMFIALTVAYVVSQGSLRYDSELHRDVRTWKPFALPYLQLSINSILLVLSSLTLERARRGMVKKAEFAHMGIVPPGQQKDLFWLTFTMILGFGFLVGQVLAWNVLRAQGAFRGHNISSNLFIAFTGLHAAHLAGGLIALLYTSLGQRFRMKFESQRIRVEITAWYWHFMGVLWLAIFALLHFTRGG